jgi:hypothetical protein
MLGAEKLGIVLPPANIDVVPVSETNTRFELSAVAVAQGNWQNVVVE